MTAAKYDFETMVQVAKMYYHKNMNQQDIAKEFGWSRSMISMLLSEAKECGIIEVKIYDPTVNDEDIAYRLRERFGLKECIVVPTSATAPALLTKIVAGQAALYAEKQMNSHSVLGVAWGTTCYEFMAAFPCENRLADINVVPLIGGANRVGSEFQLNEMVRIFAEKVKGVPSFIYAPALAETMEDKMLYLKSMYMKEICAKWRMLDFAIISVGAPPEYYAGQAASDPFSLHQKYTEQPNRPVGDIAARRITYSGEFVNADYDARLIGVQEDDLRRVKHVICVACGKHKVLSIIGMLRTNIVHSLITDSSTAKLVLEVLELQSPALVAAR